LVPAWKQAIDKEMDALVSRRTWELVSAPTNDVVGYRWVYTLKYHPYDSVDWHKARLLSKVILRPIVWITLRLFHQLLD